MRISRLLTLHTKCVNSVMPIPPFYNQI